MSWSSQSRVGWDQQPLVEGQTENLIRYWSRIGWPQLPFADDAAHTFNDVGSSSLLRQQLLQQIFGDFLWRPCREASRRLARRGQIIRPIIVSRESQPSVRCDG